jgi:hypothetical protein
MYELYRRAESDTVSEMLIFWKGNLPTVFEDISEEHGGNYYYEIRTSDLTGNNSKNSRAVYVHGAEKKKAVVRAEPSLNGKSILISWDIPEGLKPAKTILYRGTDSAPISIHHTLEGAGQTFADNDIEINTYYRYLIKIFDENGKTVVTSGQIVISALSGSDSESKQK